MAIDDSDVIAAIGPAFSGPAELAAPLYGEAGLLAASSSATNPTLTEQGFPTFLRAVPNDNAQGAGMAEFLAAQDGVEKVIVVDDVSPYGEGLSDVAVESLTELGFEVERASVPADTPDYSGAARNVVQSGADAMHGRRAWTTRRSARSRSAWSRPVSTASVSLGDGSNDVQFISLAGSASDQWYLTCPCTDATAEAATVDFAERYQTAFNQPPGTYSAESYDVAQMIIGAIAELGADASRESVYQAVATGSYEGLTKTFEFDETGEFTNDAIFIYQVEGAWIRIPGADRGVDRRLIRRDSVAFPVLAGRGVLIAPRSCSSPIPTRKSAPCPSRISGTFSSSGWCSARSMPSSPLVTPLFTVFFSF